MENGPVNKRSKIEKCNNEVKNLVAATETDVEDENKRYRFQIYYNNLKVVQFYAILRHLGVEPTVHGIAKMTSDQLEVL